MLFRSKYAEICENKYGSFFLKSYKSQTYIFDMRCRVGWEKTCECKKVLALLMSLCGTQQSAPHENFPSGA